MLFFNIKFQILRKIKLGGELIFIDNSKSMNYQNYRKKGKYYTIDQGKIAKFSDFNKDSSPLNDYIERITLYSVLKEKKATFISDFNYTDELPETFRTNIEFLPLKKESIIDNLEMIDLTPKKTVLRNKNRFILRIKSSKKIKTDLSISSHGKELYQKRIALIAGVNNIPITISFKKAGVYPLQVKIDSNDSIVSDNYLYLDMVLKKEHPDVVIIYRYPSADIGIISRFLHGLGINVKTLHIDKVKNLEKYDGYVLYNTDYLINNDKPILIIGYTKNYGIKKEITKGLSFKGREKPYQEIIQSGYLNSGIVLNRNSRDEGIVVNIKNRYFLAFINYYKYFLKKEPYLSSVFSNIINRYSKDMNRYPHIELDADTIVNGKKVNGYFSKEDGILTINGFDVKMKNGKFSFMSTGRKINIKVNYEQNGIDKVLNRNYPVFQNDLENKYIGFDKEKYDKLREHYKHISGKDKKERKITYLNPFETIISFIIIIIALILMWL
jgi:hypothetical protein